jgi:short-subunit dehydrogenase
MKAIIIGASSGMGRELAKILAREGYEIGVVARRQELLASLQKEIHSPIFLKQADISCPEESMALVGALIQEMGGVDLAILSSGVGFLNPDFDWNKDKETIEVNALGFCAMANVFMKHFLSQGQGHLVGISSIAALRGSGCYSASKAFVSNYLEGLRHQMAKKQRAITITDIQPGFVDTAMAKGHGLFWVAPVERAARMIYRAIQKKKVHAYITSRWRLVAWLLKWMPCCLYDRFF